MFISNDEISSCFSGCDYFRLGSNQEYVNSTGHRGDAIKFTVAASRKTTGNHPLYEQIEGGFRRFFEADSVLIVPTGFLAPLIAAQALKGVFSHVLIDSQAHPALWLAAREIGAEIVSFEHCNADNIRRIMETERSIRRLIVMTDGIFSIDGRIAPLKDYLQILPDTALILVDDAHGAGVLGESGQGTVEHFRLGRNRTVQTASLAKAFGAYGGLIIGAREIIDAIWSRSSAFAGTTPLPLPVVAACKRSLSIMRKHGSVLRKRLQENIAYVKKALVAGGLPIGLDPTPIFRIVPTSDQEARRLCQKLRRSGIKPPFIAYPGGPITGFFRFAISSEHSQSELDRLICPLLRA